MNLSNKCNPQIFVGAPGIQSYTMRSQACSVLVVQSKGTSDANMLDKESSYNYTPLVSAFKIQKPLLVRVIPTETSLKTGRVGLGEIPAAYNPPDSSKKGSPPSSWCKYISLCSSIGLHC